MITIDPHDPDFAHSERQLYISQKLDIIGQLAGGISHNFNNQLTGIMGFANLICMRSGDANIKKFAEEILGICKNAGDMVRELLTFARYRPTSTVGVNVHNTISTITHLLSNSIDRRIVINCELGAERCTVLADAVQLQSALLNLALNSKDAMPKGGNITFSTKFVDAKDVKADGVDIEAAAEFGFIRIEVADNGAGFDGETRSRLFEPFFTTKGQGHVGLGLSAVYRFVKSMNGAIEVASAEGEGTSVVIMLPLHACESGAEDADAAKDREAAAAKDAAKATIDDINNAKKHKSNGTILLVDDDKGIRDSISAFLRSLGYSVFTAEDGAEAVDKYSLTHAAIDMVILDMVMPRMGGKEAFVKMKVINPGIKAVAITGFSNHSAEELVALGMLRVFHKPFSFDEMSKVVAEHI